MNAVTKHDEFVIEAFVRFEKVFACFRGGTPFASLHDAVLSVDSYSCAITYVGQVPLLVRELLVVEAWKHKVLPLIIDKVPRACPQTRSTCKRRLPYMYISPRTAAHGGALSHAPRA